MLLVYILGCCARATSDHAAAARRARQAIRAASGTWPLAARTEGDQIRRIGVLMNSAATDATYQFRARTLVPAWAGPAVGEGVKSCPRAGCGKSACPVHRFE